MTPYQLRSMTRNEALFFVAYKVRRRLLEIEPNSLGDGVITTVTEEGRFLAYTLKIISDMTHDHFTH